MSNTNTNFIINTNNNTLSVERVGQQPVVRHPHFLNQAPVDNVNFLDRHPAYREHLDSLQNNSHITVFQEPISSIQDGQNFVQNINRSLNPINTSYLNEVLDIDSINAINDIQRASLQGMRHMLHNVPYSELESFRQRVINGNFVYFSPFSRAEAITSNSVYGIDDVFAHFFTFFGHDALNEFSRFITLHPQALGPVMLFIFSRLFVLFRSSIFWRLNSPQEIYKLIMDQLRIALMRVRRPFVYRNFTEAIEFLRGNTLTNLNESLRSITPSNGLFGSLRMMFRNLDSYSRALIYGLIPLFGIGPIFYFFPSIPRDAMTSVGRWFRSSRDRISTDNPDRRTVGEMFDLAITVLYKTLNRFNR